MPEWKKNIFVRVVLMRMKNEERTKEEILADYPSLTDAEKQEILSVVGSAS